MQSFLEEVTDHILENYPDSTGDLCIVTPNRRAGLFFRKYFGARINTPMWAPEVLSIEDLINKVSECTVCDQLTLLFEFYTVYRELEKERADTIDTFFSWAPTLLRDFDDIDNALAKPEKLYAYLEDIRYIDTWNPDGAELTSFQKDYLGFIKKLHPFHKALGAHMANMNMAWQGFSSRRAASRIASGEAEMPWEKIIFTGFNALTQAEETIIQALLEQGRAEYLTDTDPFYEDDPGHEAGRFIRKYREKFRTDREKHGNGFFRTTTKKIRIFGVAKNASQARLAGNLLQQMPGLNDDESTAVVLANENLLIPMLNALPANTDNINVTMGYPLSKTNMFEFFDTLLKLHLRAITSTTAKKEQPAYYHKDLYRLFSHSNSSLLWDPDQGVELTTDLLKKLSASSQVLWHFDELAALSEDPMRFAQSFSFLKQNWQQHPDDIFPAFIELAGQLDKLFREKAGKQGSDIVNTPLFVDFESLYYFAKTFRQAESYLARFPFLASLKTLYRLMKQSASETRLSFSGEPLKGLQVMGMLETRSLDFKNIILLSANENILPKPKSNYSFISYEVKKTFGLRLYHEQDAIYAYHFYRLLQRSENISLIFNTHAQDLGSNEKSRYITQLQHELEGYNPNISIREEIVSMPPPVDASSHAISIPKTKEIMQHLEEISGKGFSPSALSRYINCPLQFYFERLARLEEAEEVEETMEARTIGTVVHGVLEDLYGGLEGQVLKTEDVDAMKQQLTRVLNQRFGKEYRGGNISTGKNLLLYHLTQRYLENLLKAEKTAIEKADENNQVITLLSLEESLRATLVLDQNGGQAREVIIAGKADRIDRLGDMVRVIDYKTGRIGPYELSYQEWDIPFTNSDKAKNFQLLCYAWLYDQSHPGERKIEPGIISVRYPARGSQTMKYPGGQGALEPDHLAAFEKELKKLIAGILDATLPFSQTKEEKNCRYCAFSTLCRRF